jgi:hypothetical protein
MNEIMKMMQLIGLGSHFPPRGGPIVTLPRNAKRGKSRGINHAIRYPESGTINGRPVRKMSDGTIYAVTQRGWRKVKEAV